MKQKEEKILGIIAIILGMLALLDSWLPTISVLAFSSIRGVTFDQSIELLLGPSEGIGIFRILLIIILI